jgi:hypothetical protein
MFPGQGATRSCMAAPGLGRTLPSAPRYAPNAYPGHGTSLKGNPPPSIGRCKCVSTALTHRQVAAKWCKLVSSPTHTTRAPTTPHSNTVQYTPRRSPPCMPAPPYRPLQLAQRTSFTGTITRTAIRHHCRTLSPMRWCPGLIQTNGPGAIPPAT